MFRLLGLVVAKKAEAYGEVTLPLADSARTGAGAGQWNSADWVWIEAPNIALSLSLEPFWTQPWLIFPWNWVLEHEAGVGVNTKLVDVARAGVIHT